MTTTPEKADIVEHVERAIFGECQGYSYKPEARAAIRATLEYLRENVSEEMARAWHKDFDDWLDERIKDEFHPFRAMLSAALNDIEGGAG